MFLISAFVPAIRDPESCITVFCQSHKVLFLWPLGDPRGSLVRREGISHGQSSDSARNSGQIEPVGAILGCEEVCLSMLLVRSWSMGMKRSN